jgi:glycerol-3-phosphate acyltransferase PlsY
MATSGFIIFRHRANLARLLAGTEPRIGERA